MPSNRNICVSGRYSAIDVHVMALDLARKWLDIDEEESKKFGREILKYHKNEFPHHSNEKDPVKYWSQFNNGTSQLAAFAILLFKIIPSSASVERLFSKLARTKTKYRNSMLPRNLAAHSIIKLEALNEFKIGGRKDIEIDAQMEWEFDEIDFDKIEDEDEEAQDEDAEMEEIDIDTVENLVNLSNNIVPRFDYKMEPLITEVITKPKKTDNYNYRSRASFKIKDY